MYLRQRGAYRRKMGQIYRQFHPKRANWIKARREFHKCRAQQRQFDWQIKQAKAKYEQARGVPETNLLGCFEDKPRRAMKWIRGRYLDSCLPAMWIGHFDSSCSWAAISISSE